MVDLHAPTRRELLLTSGVLFAWAYLPKVAMAEGRDPRLLVIVLRGALDGLAAVPPVGDPNWVRLRGDEALSMVGPNPVLPLNDLFGMNPAMPNLHRLYRAGQATILHAVATPYRERSHFDGQDILESGFPKPGVVDSGWLNRALATLAPAERVKGHSRSAFAVGTIAPLVVRGPAPIVSWSPPTLPAASNDTLERLLDVYRHTAPTFAQALEERVGLAAVVGAEPTRTAKGKGAAKVNGARVRDQFAQSAGTAAKFLARPDGPRIGAISFTGWDTHANEGPRDGRLAALLGALDGALEAVEREMGEAWRETAVAVVTEFGRTARINGTAGTDHGTATVALLAGGALKGGRVITDWPGLADAQLYDGRDLRPTMDLRAALKGLLKDHLRVPETALATTVFPDSSAIRPMTGLLA
jgi:uncharacterized protein (DUF1501 family)